MNRPTRERDRKRAGSERRDALHRASGGEFYTVEIPEGMSIFQPKAGVYKIDVVPYEVGEGNPYAAKGYWYYERTFWLHRGVGVNNESVICMAKTFGKPCAVCDYRAKMAKDPNTDEALIASLKPKERQLWLVYDHGEPDKGVQLWESSYHTFGRLLERRRRGADEDEGYIRNFDDWEAGATLRVMFAEEDAGGYTYLNATSIEFKPRPKGLPEELLNHGVCLDSLLKEVDYARVKRLLMQAEGAEEDEAGETDEPGVKVGRSAGKLVEIDDEEDSFNEPKAVGPKEGLSRKKSKPKDGFVDEDETEKDEDDWVPSPGNKVKGKGVSKKSFSAEDDEWA